MRFSSVVRTILVATLAIGTLGSPLTAAAETPLTAAAKAPAAITAPAGIATVVTPGLKGYDNLGAESRSQINCLSAAGYSFDLIDVIGDAWQGEYNAAAAAGMTVVLFQGYDPSTWADPAQGTNRGGIIAAKAANTARYPKGAQIFLNVEQNTGPGVTAAGMLKWINNWTAAVRKAGYVPGIYVGVPQLLTAAQINSIPHVVFWRSASGSAPQAARGFVVQQPTVSRPACGIVHGIDTNVAVIDRGGLKLTGAAFPAKPVKPIVAGGFAPLAPTRLLDTRSRLGAAGPVAGAKGITVQITGRGGVPSTGVSAVVLNITATAPTSSGYVTAYPAGSARPLVSNLNHAAKQTIANLATVRLGTGGRVTLYNGSTGTVQLLADVAGYYLSGKSTAPGTYVPISPTRLLDTRPRGVSAKSVTPVTLAGRAGIPATGFDAVVLNVTVVAPAAPGYLTAYASGTTRPDASNLNFAAGRTIPNMVTVAVGAGRVSLFNGARGSVNLLADVAGYYIAGKRIDPGAFSPLAPARILDTRSNIGATGKVPAVKAISLLVRGKGGVPAGASAVVLNVTAVNPTASGYLTVFPSDRSAPTASNINFAAASTTANQVIVPIGADGRVVLLNQSAGTTDLLADVAGYFLG